MTELEPGLYTPSGFESRSDIMKKNAIQELSIQRPDVDLPSSFNDLLDRYEELQGIEAESALYKPSVEIKVETGKFPFFMFRPLADLHMGASECDIPSLRANLNDIKEYPIYSALLGDVIDGYGPTAIPEGMFGDVLKVNDQATLAKSFFEEYKDKMFCAVHTNSHEGWIDKKTGFDLNKYMLENLNITPLQNGGLLNLKVNDISYKIMIFHKLGKYHSSLNLTNGMKRQLDMGTEGNDCDMVIAAHRHIGATEQLIKRNRMVTVCQLGTFLKDAAYAETNGLQPQAQPYFPTFFFDGRKKNIEFIVDRQASIDLAKAYMVINGG